MEIPASALYYTRQLQGSPVTISVYPGDVNPSTTSISGDGLAGCVAMEEVSCWCSKVFELVKTPSEKTASARFLGMDKASQ